MAAESTGKIGFNPHHFVKGMTGNGMPERQAEGLADAMMGMVDAMAGMISSDLATKQDIALVRKDLEVGLAGVRKDLEVGLAGVRKDLEVGLVGVRKDLEVGLAQVDVRMAEISANIAEAKVITTRWAVGIALALAALIVSTAALS